MLENAVGKTRAFRISIQNDAKLTRTRFSYSLHNQNLNQMNSAECGFAVIHFNPNKEPSIKPLKEIQPKSLILSSRTEISHDETVKLARESKIAHNIFLSIFPQARDEAPRKSLIKTSGYKLSTQQGKPCHHQLITDSQVRHKSSTIKPLSCRDNSIHASQHIRKTQTTSKRANVSPRTSSITRSSTEMRAIPAFDSSLPIQKPSYTNFCLNNSANLQIPN